VRLTLVIWAQRQHLQWAAHAQAQPILADLLGSLEGDAGERLSARLDEVTAAISAGKFSQAWQYPELISAGEALLEEQRREAAERCRAGARRKRGVAAVEGGGS